MESRLTLVPVQSSVGPVPVSTGATEGTCWPESLDGTLYDRGGLPSYTDMKVEYKFVRKKKVGEQHTQGGLDSAQALFSKVVVACIETNSHIYGLINFTFILFHL